MKHLLRIKIYQVNGKEVNYFLPDQLGIKFNRHHAHSHVALNDAKGDYKERLIEVTAPQTTVDLLATIFPISLVAPADLDAVKAEIEPEKTLKPEELDTATLTDEEKVAILKRRIHG